MRKVGLCLAVALVALGSSFQAHGAGDEEAVTRSTRQGLWMALVLTIPAVGALYLAGPLLVIPYRTSSTETETVNGQPVTRSVERWETRVLSPEIVQLDTTSYRNPSQLRPGDLVFWGSSSKASSIYHVALYAGNGQIIHAPRTGRPVTEESMYYWRTPDFYARP